jgi:arsenite methyltransferase
MQSQDARRKVADFFGQRVTNNGRGGIANPGKQDYRPEDMANVPSELMESSFGCGNPLAFSGIPKGATVLDLGCGAGLDLLLAAECVGEEGRVIGVDMTDEMLARARENAARAGYRNIEVRKGLIEALPVASSSVDWVISNCVINLSPEKDKAFAEIARVLKPGGTMVISDTVATDLPNWIKRSSFLYCNCVSGAISEEAYLDGLRKAGLVDASVKERLLYSPSQLVAAVEAMLPRCLVGPSFGGKPLIRGFLNRISRQLSERFWSAKFIAKRAAAPVANSMEQGRMEQADACFAPTLSPNH